MIASQTLVAMEVHVSMGWLPSHVSVFRATRDYIVKRVSCWLICFCFFSFSVFQVSVGS